VTRNGGVAANDVFTFGLNNAFSFVEGMFQAGVLSGLSIPYTYPANIGETFELRAEIEARVEAPAGKGGVVILGDELNHLVTVLEGAIGADTVANFSDGLTAGLTGVSLPLKPIVAADQDTLVEVAPDAARTLPFLNVNCGLLGAESALLVAAVGVLGVLRRKRA
jgi:hypothetical protein